MAQNFNSESFFCSSILIFNSFNCFFILSNWAGAGGCYKGLLDLKNTLNQVARIINKNVSNIKIILNNIKNNDVNITILKWLKEANLSQFLFKTQIKHSDTFAKNTVKLDTIWTNPTYWRQK
ncbi:MAG: AAA family ATPase [Spiroplasma endosymbiont of Drosophila atripex]|nr:MAG: AAA family ATPase [Spiroplasma endosymbiont of Drosophila atripex]